MFSPPNSSQKLTNLSKHLLFSPAAYSIFIDPIFDVISINSAPFSLFHTAYLPYKDLYFCKMEGTLSKGWLGGERLSRKWLWILPKGGISLYPVTEQKVWGGGGLFISRKSPNAPPCPVRLMEIPPHPLLLTFCHFLFIFLGRHLFFELSLTFSRRKTDETRKKCDTKTPKHHERKQF